MKKLQTLLPPFGWDTEPVMGAEAIVEEAFIDVQIPQLAATPPEFLTFILLHASYYSTTATSSSILSPQSWLHRNTFRIYVKHFMDNLRYLDFGPRSSTPRCGVAARYRQE